MNKNHVDFNNLHGEFYTFDEFRELNNVQGTFLDYQSVIRTSSPKGNDRLPENKHFK